jgi:hypothetical protein
MQRTSGGSIIDNLRNLYRFLPAVVQAGLATAGTAATTYLGGPTAYLAKNIPTIAALPYVINQYTNLWNAIADYGYALPDIKPELSLFLKLAEDPKNPNGKRNLDIVKKIVGLNKRYIELNVSPYKDDFNKIIHAVTINTVRDPTAAPRLLGQAELDLARILKYHRNPPLPGLYNLFVAEPAEVSPGIIASKYHIEKAIPITEKYAHETDLPSSALYEYVDTEYDPTRVTIWSQELPRYPAYRGAVTHGPALPVKRTHPTYKLPAPPKIQITRKL